jgi:hypothetical protein
MRLKTGEPWRFISASEFETFLTSYPRTLEVHPPIERKAKFRSYSDATLGRWPGNVVATAHTGRTTAVFGVRADVYEKPCATP